MAATMTLFHIRKTQRFDRPGHKLHKILIDPGEIKADGYGTAVFELPSDDPLLKEMLAKKNSAGALLVPVAKVTKAAEATSKGSEREGFQKEITGQDPSTMRDRSAEA